MPLCKEMIKSTYYVDPTIHTWMRHQAINEDVLLNDLVNEAFELLRENRRLAALLDTKKTTAVHPAKKGGKK